MIGRYTSGLYHVEMHFTLLGPPQLALSVEMRFAFLFAGAPPQLALSVGFLFESLFAGAPASGVCFCMWGVFLYVGDVFVTVKRFHIKM